MLLLAICEAIAVAAIGAAWYEGIRVVPRGSRAHRLIVAAVVAMVASVAGLGLSVASLVQDSLGIRILGSPATLKSSARQWVETHGLELPDRANVGRNIRLIASGMDFYRAHKPQLPLDMQQKFEDCSRLSAAPTRLLTPAEERRYYDAATDIVTMIGALAGTAASATSGKTE